jgi:hypothetical protein
VCVLFASCLRPKRKELGRIGATLQGPRTVAPFRSFSLPRQGSGESSHERVSEPPHDQGPGFSVRKRNSGVNTIE